MTSKHKFDIVLKTAYLHKLFLDRKDRFNVSMGSVIFDRIFALCKSFYIIDTSMFTYMVYPPPTQMVIQMQNIFSLDGEKEADAFFLICSHVFGDVQSKQHDTATCDETPWRSPIFVAEITQAFTQKHSYVKKDNSRKQSYCHTTAISNRYDTFSSFSSAMLTEGAPNAVAFRSAHRQLTFGYDEESALDDHYYYFKIDGVHASAVIMTIDFAFYDTGFVSDSGGHKRFLLRSPPYADYASVGLDLEPLVRAPAGRVEHHHLVGPHRRA